MTHSHCDLYFIFQWFCFNVGCYFIDFYHSWCNYSGLGPLYFKVIMTFFSWWSHFEHLSSDFHPSWCKWSVSHDITGLSFCWMRRTLEYMRDFGHAWDKYSVWHGKWVSRIDILHCPSYHKSRPIFELGGRLIDIYKHGNLENGPSSLLTCYRVEKKALRAKCNGQTGAWRTDVLADTVSTLYPS